MRRPLLTGVSLAALCVLPLAAGAQQGLRLKGEPALALLPPAPAELLPVFIEADTVRGHADKETEAEGNVRLRRGTHAVFADRLRYDKTVRSSGWRLRADKEALRTFLNAMGLDLIVEIAITRRNKGYDYSRYGEEEAKESPFDRVILLRRDGTIEAAEGRLGTWTAPRA